MNVDAWLSMRARKTPVRSLGRTHKTARLNAGYSWLLTGARTPEQLRRHRAALERDCFTSTAHCTAMQEAAKAYDAQLLREKNAKPKGRPKKLPSLQIPKSKWREINALLDVA